MHTTMERERVLSPLNNQPSLLKDVLARLDIVPLTPECVAEYKRAELEQMTCRLRPDEGREIKEHEFGLWEHTELRRLSKNTECHELSGDAPLIRFWEVPGGVRCYTYLRWVKVPLEKAGDIPEFVAAKVEEIITNLPDATFAAEELRSERRLYDPFLIVSYGEESYYIEVWKEPGFERGHS